MRTSINFSKKFITSTHVKRVLVLPEETIPKISVSRKINYTPSVTATQKPREMTNIHKRTRKSIAPIQNFMNFISNHSLPKSLSCYLNYTLLS